MATDVSVTACPLCCSRLRPSAQAHADFGPPRPWTTQRARVRVAFDNDPTAPALARRALSSALADELDVETTASGQLVLSELVTNAVTHGSVNGGRAKLAIWLTPRYLQIEVEDHGSGFTPLNPGSDLEREGGRGLLVVDELASAWGASIGPGTTVWCQLERGRS